MTRAGAFDGLDLITLTGLRAVGHHGVFEHERRDGQEFVVDVVLGLSTAAAAGADDLAATVDYGVVAEQVHALIAGEPVDLIETLAERIAAAALEHGRVQAVEVTVHKPSAPVTVAFADIAVTIVRGRR